MGIAQLDNDVVTASQVPGGWKVSLLRNGDKIRRAEVYNFEDWFISQNVNPDLLLALWRSIIVEHEDRLKKTRAGRKLIREYGPKSYRAKLKPCPA